ncbi:MAG: ComEC/Rec2 family competence protein [Planctomycetaceae bacterium]|nr:ComEC/Rec2 family competence protein [Planctomycetaceae bacterium]
MQTKIPYQPLPPLFVAAVLGILADRFLAPSVLFWVLFCLMAIVTWFVVARFRSAGTQGITETQETAKTQNIASLLRSCTLFVACGAFFGFWHHDHWSRFAHNDIGSYTGVDIGGLTPPALAQSPALGQPAALIGTVVEMPRFYPTPPPFSGQIFESSEKTLFTLRAEQLRDGNDWISVSGNVLVTVYDDCQHFRIGDRLQLFGELMQPPKPSNPGDYDYYDYLRGHRTLASLRCPGNTAAALTGSNRLSPGRWLESIRRNGLANLRQHLSPQTIAIAEAMIFGVRESVDDDVRQSMLDTGTMHLLSISGLHVTLIAGLAAWMLRQLRCSRRTAALSMIVFVLFYLLLTDVRPPAIRATALTCSIAMALYMNRLTLTVNLLSASALVVLLVNPSELFQFGAQLSFIAMGSFLWLPRDTRLKSFLSPSSTTEGEWQKLSDIERVETTSWRWLHHTKKMCQWTAELFLISLVIWLFATPILMQNIHLFTPVAILVNPLLWLPLTAAMSCGFITAMIGQVPLLGSVFGFGTDWSFWMLLEVIAWFQWLGGHYWVPGPPGWWNLGFYGVFALFTFLPIRRPHWSMLLVALIVWIFVGIGAGYYRDAERLRADRLTLSVLAIGHGNGVFITTPEKRTIICDVGCLTSPLYAADVMSRSLWRQGTTHIDALLISHPDNDHFNGVSVLADRFSMGAVLISPYTTDIQSESDMTAWARLMEKLEAKRIPVRIIGEGDTLAEYGLPHSIILHPPKEGFAEQHNTNATSVVLRVEHRGVGILLPGDLDGRSPSPFLLREPMPTAIVMVPHHGGRSQQMERLLEWATPQTLIFSTGKLTYKPEALEEFRQQGYEVRSTFVGGVVVIDVEK